MTPRDITVSGKRLRVWTGGTGTVLLLLHSAWGDAEFSWSPVWDGLSAYFTVLAPDLPGFGESDEPAEPTLEAMAMALKELLEIQKTGPAIVVGNSFGAAIAIEFASHFPERSIRVVLVNGGYMPVIPMVLKKIISLPVIENLFQTLMRNASYSDKAFAKAFPDTSKPPAMFFERIRQNRKKQARAVFNAFMRQKRPQSQPLVPSKMIWGTGDNLITGKQLETLKKWLGNPDFIPIEGAGHMPQVEQPAAFVEALKKIGGEGGI